MLTFRHRFRDGSVVEINADLDHLSFAGSGLTAPEHPTRFMEWVMWRAHVNTILVTLCRKRFQGSMAHP
jgi:hypothetical protein